MSHLALLDWLAAHPDIDVRISHRIDATAIDLYANRSGSGIRRWVTDIQIRETSDAQSLLLFILDDMAREAGIS